MSDERIFIDYKMIEEQLKEKSAKLGISLYELIDRYIRRGLYSDDYYIQPQIPREELDEICKRDMERDRKRGIPPKKHDFGVFIGRCKNSDD